MDSMVMFEFKENKDLEPKTWDQYIDMLVKIYKFKNPDKVKGSIFNQGSSSKDTSEPMDTSMTEKKKWKGKGKGKAQTNVTEKRHHTWCEKAGNKYATTIHDLKDCRLKDAAPKVASAPKGSPPSKPQSGNYVSGSGQKKIENKMGGQNRSSADWKKAQQIRLMQEMKALDDDDECMSNASSVKEIDTLYARIKAMPSSASSSGSSVDGEDDTKKDSAMVPAKKQKRQRKRKAKMDFPKI
jgi:hypothetical protein